MSIDRARRSRSSDWRSRETRDDIEEAFEFSVGYIRRRHVAAAAEGKAGCGRGAGGDERMHDAVLSWESTTLQREVQRRSAQLGCAVGVVDFTHDWRDQEVDDVRSIGIIARDAGSQSLQLHARGVGQLVPLCVRSDDALEGAVVLGE